MFRERGSSREYHSRLGYAVDETCGIIKFVFPDRCESILNKILGNVGGIYCVLSFPIGVAINYVDSFGELEKINESQQTPAPLDLTD